jgi:hypothetical protein
MTLRKFTFINDAEDGAHTEQAATDELALGKLAVSGVGGVGVDLGSQQIANLNLVPTAGHHAASKAYVDSVAAGLDPKDAVRAISTIDIASLSGPKTIDGESIIAGDRVLLVGQTTGSGAIDNGIWVVQTGAWTRPTDFPAGGNAASAFTFVTEGTANADSGWVCTTDPPDVIDTNANNWTQFSGAGQITAGGGLTKDGNTLDVNPGDGIEIVSDRVAVDIAATTPGLQLVGTTPDKELAVLAEAAGGLEVNANGIAAKLNGTTLQKGASGLSVLGVPAAGTWEIGGVATGSTVTAPNLDELTDGSTTTLHSHAGANAAEVLQELLTALEGCAKGDPVAWSSTADKFAKGDAGNTPDSRIFGVVLDAVAADGQEVVVRKGIAPGVLVGATPGAQYWLNTGGGLTPTIPSGVGLRLIRIGWAVNATDLEVSVQDGGKR